MGDLNMEYELIEDEELQKQTAIIDEIMSTEGLMVLCQNAYARELIDSKYREKPVEYYESYLQTNDRDMGFRKTMLDIEEENAYNQLVGILMYERINDLTEDFRTEILQKCYKWVYRDIKNSHACDIGKILNSYKRRIKKSMLTKRQGMEITLAALQIASFEKKPLMYSSFNTIMDLCSYSTDAMDSAKGNYLSLNKKNRLYDTFPTECMSTKRFSNIGDVVRYISSDAMNSPIMSDSMMYYIEYLRAIGLDDFSMTNTSYTNEDINILTQFLNYDNGYIISEDSKKAIISALFIILSLKKKYINAKRFALNTNMEKEYKESLKVRQEFTDKEDAYKKKIAELEKQLEAEKNKNEILVKENSLKQKEIKRLNDNLNSTENNNKEVAALRKAIYSFETEMPTDKVVSYEEKVELISNYKIVVFGGIDSWVNNIKSELDNIKFVTDDAKNTDVSFIKNADFVFINVIGLSHAFYYKIINSVRKHEIDFAYIGNPNKELTVNRMYSVILEEIKK